MKHQTLFFSKDQSKKKILNKVSSAANLLGFLRVKPLRHSGLFYSEVLNDSISHLRVTGLVFFSLYFLLKRNAHFLFCLYKQCKP